MQATKTLDAKSSLVFVVAFGIVGPFLASLGASGLAVGLIAGGGELCGCL
jgi:hypothetical protein